MVRHRMEGEQKKGREVMVLYCYVVGCVPPKFICWNLVSQNVTVFEDRVFKEEIKIKLGQMGEP